VQCIKDVYIVSICQPEASFDLSFATQVINPKKEDVTALNKWLQLQINNPTKGLIFVKLDINILCLFVFTNASFTNNKDLSLQIGYILILEDTLHKANIIYWSLIKCKKVTRNILASELYTMAYRFDINTTIKSTVEQLLQIKLPLVFCTDLKLLYECLVKLSTTQEKCFMIDVMCLC